MKILKILNKFYKENMESIMNNNIRLNYLTAMLVLTSIPTSSFGNAKEEEGNVDVRVKKDVQIDVQIIEDSVFHSQTATAIINQQTRLLSFVDKAKLASISLGKFYLTTLKPELKQEIHTALKLLDIPGSSINKLLILGSKEEGPEKIQFAAITYPIVDSCYPLFVKPYAILVDTDWAEQASSSRRKYTFLHEAGHVKHFLEKEYFSPELNEVIAEIYALTTLVKNLKKEELLALCKEKSIFSLDRPYLDKFEFTYYASQLRTAQQKDETIDVFAFAEKIIADRKKDGYEERINQKAATLY